MNNTDKHGRLAEEPFTCAQTKDGRLLLFCGGREVKVLAGAQAAALWRKMEGASPQKRQLALAKATGNFKRGNERAAKQKGKR